MADFQPKFVDLVRNTTTTVGTLDFALGPPVMGYTSFTVAVQIGDSFYYSAIGVDKPNEREVGRGTLQANGTISRNPISGTKTNFSMGNKTVALIAAAEWYSQVQAGANAGTRAALAALPSSRAAVRAGARGHVRVGWLQPVRQCRRRQRPGNLHRANQRSDGGERRLGAAIPW